MAIFGSNTQQREVHKMLSEIVSKNTQIDGRCYVRERHIDDDGVETHIEYLAAVGADHEKIMTDRAEQMCCDKLAMAEMVVMEPMAMDSVCPMCGNPAGVLNGCMVL